MKLSFYFVCILYGMVFSEESSGRTSDKTFFIGGLFPADSEDLATRLSLGIYPQVAAQFAVREIESSGMLSSYNVSLKLRSFNSGCTDSASVFSYLKIMELSSSRRGKKI